VSGSDNNGSVGPYDSIWFSFQVPPDDPAPSSGETGASCGPAEEAPCETPCRVWVQPGTINAKVWQIKRSKGCGTALCSCSGMDDAYCGGEVTNLSAYPACGLASDHDIGFECNVPCATGAALLGTDSITLTITVTDGVCACAAGLPVFLCLNAETGRYESLDFTFCGSTIDVLLYEDAGDWRLEGLGTAAPAADMVGPWEIIIFGGECDGATISVEG
jgi:hypothetical protein